MDELLPWAECAANVLSHVPFVLPSLRRQLSHVLQSTNQQSYVFDCFVCAQIEASMILNSIVTSEKSEHTEAVVEAGALPHLVQLLRSTNETANLQVEPQHAR